MGWSSRDHLCFRLRVKAALLVNGIGTTADMETYQNTNSTEAFATKPVIPPTEWNTVDLSQAVLQAKHEIPPEEINGDTDCTAENSDDNDDIKSDAAKQQSDSEHADAPPDGESTESPAKDDKSTNKGDYSNWWWVPGVGAPLLLAAWAIKHGRQIRIAAEGITTGAWIDEIGKTAHYRFGKHTTPPDYSTDVTGTARVRLIDSFAAVKGKGHVEALGNSNVVARDQAEVELFDSTHAYLKGSSSAIAHDRALVNAYDKSCVWLLGKGAVKITHEATAFLQDGSCEGSGQSRVYAFGAGKVTLTEKAHCEQAEGSTGNLLLYHDSSAVTRTAGRVIARGNSMVDHRGTGPIEAHEASRVQTTAPFVTGTGRSLVKSTDAKKLILRGEASAEITNCSEATLENESQVTKAVDVGRIDISHSSSATVESAQAITVFDRGKLLFVGQESKPAFVYMEHDGKARIVSGRVQVDMHNRTLLMVEKGVTGSVHAADTARVMTNGDHELTVDGQALVEAGGQARIIVPPPESVSETPRSLADSPTIKLANRFDGLLEVRNSAKVEASGARDILVEGGEVEITCQGFTGRIFVRSGKACVKGSATVIASNSSRVEVQTEGNQKAQVFATDESNVECHGKNFEIRVTGKAAVNAEVEGKLLVSEQGKAKVRSMNAVVDTKGSA
ncbi:MAG: hypothetical protein K2Z81_19650, partial [Cyanobacteria bacterium]|nr:hypothetical protein [Cyanobacteriota bacterium]